MIVRMYMTRAVEILSPDDTLKEAILKMKNLRIRRLIVTSNQVIVGMVCQHDLVTAFPHDVHPFSPLGAESTAAMALVSTVMKRPVLTIDQNEPIEHAAMMMARHHIGGLPVTNLNKLVGVITESDIFRALTTLLAGSGNSVRITFDVTEDENILSFLATMTQRYDLNLLSLITFHEQDRRLAVARVRGERVAQLVNEIWTSGHRVINIVEAESKRRFDEKEGQ